MSQNVPSSRDSVRIGHWTSPDGLTGCTVLVFDSLSPAVVDVRGSAPGTRETDLLASGRTVRALDAIVLTGGSAFGLAAADGVMNYLREQERGFPTTAGPVPIVAAAVIFDLMLGSQVAPNADSGYSACLELTSMPRQFAGRVGGGTGATIQKLWGAEHTQPGGLGISTVETMYGSVSAVLVLNSAGAAWHEEHDPEHAAISRQALFTRPPDLGARESTTIGAIIVSAGSDHALLERCAISAHDGLARSIAPAHTVYDGDLFFAVGLTPGSSDPGAALAIPTAAEVAVEQAISALLAR